MGGWRRFGGATTAGSAAVFLVLASSAAAQEVARATEVAGPEGIGALVEEARMAELSGQLGERAEELEAEFRWGEAAPLYEQSARLRSPTDPESHRSYADAARCYYYSDRPDDAGRMWEAAGERAAAHGDLSAAATSYMKAAIAAYEGGDAERSSLNGLRALALAESPELDDMLRSRIREHIILNSVVVDGRR